MASTCPDENTLLEYVEGAGSLSPTRRGELEVHLDGCRDCAALVADAVREMSDVHGAKTSNIGPRTPSPFEPATVVESGRPSLPMASGPGGDSPGEASPGDQLGRYILLEQLGKGGMGVVFSAFDTKLQRMVALKLIRDRKRRGATEATEGTARLIREARALAQLNHPNIVQVYDADVEADVVFVAMELCEGEDLRARMRRVRPMPWREALDLFLAAGEGLAAAHAAGILHRDFKPDSRVGAPAVDLTAETSRAITA